MELWIRSQNKHTLIKCNYITTLEKDIYGNTEYTIINEDELELGKYDSVERLLEVLDEIQKLLQPQKLLKDYEGLVYTNGDNNLHIANPSYAKIQELLTYVYEMPKE